MQRVIRWSIAHPRLVIGGSVLFSLGLAALLPLLTIEVDFKGFLASDDPAVIALERAERRYGAQEILVVVVEATGGVFNASTLAKIHSLEARIDALSGVDEVIGPTSAQIITADEQLLHVSAAAEQPPDTLEAIALLRQRLQGSPRLADLVVTPSGDAAAIVVRLDPDASRMDIAGEVARLAEEFATPEVIQVAGLPAMHRAMSQSIFRDIYVLVPAVLLVLAAVLLWGFRNARVLLVSMPIVGMSVIWALAAMAIARQPFTPFALALPVMTMAIGIADAIHVLGRFREEVRREPDVHRAVTRTMEEMAGPVIMTSLTTAAGFLSLATSLIEAQRMFGLFVAFAVLVAMGLSLTFLPAMLVLLPPMTRRAAAAGQRFGRLLAAAGGGIYRARYALLILGVGASIVCLLAVPRIRVETVPQAFLGNSHPVVRAMDAVDRHFGGSLQIAVELDTGRSEGLKDPSTLRSMQEIARALEEIEGISHAVSLADLVSELFQKLSGDDPAYRTVPEDARTISQLLLLYGLQGGDLGQMATADFRSGEIVARVGLGSTRQLADVQQEVTELLGGLSIDAQVEQVDVMRAFISLFAKMPRSQALSLLTSALAAAAIVSLLMRSVIAGAVCIIPLLFTVLVNFGIMGYTGVPLDIATLMVASTAIGVGIDYAIHFTERFRREMRDGRTARHALVETMRTEGTAISYNALAVGLGFMVFLASSFRGLANVGFLVSMTMFVSAAASFTIVPGMLILWRRWIIRE